MLKSFSGKFLAAACFAIPVLCGLLLPASSFANAEPEKLAITIGYANNAKDAYFRERDAYFVEILELVVKHSEAQITLVPVTMGSQVESRVVMSVQQGTLDVHWLHTNEQMESQLLPIRIPLYKGLIGWRLMLVRGEDKNLLEGVSTLEALRKFPVLQSYDWPDTAILKASGFQVESSVGFRSLFRMLRHRRADLFPRSIIEIWGELEDQPDLNLMVDRHVALYYPTAYYFFVAKENVKLHDVIEQGLKRAIASGDFERHFERYYEDIIRKANLSERALISIDNPNLPPLTPLENKALWFSPVKASVPNAPE